MQAAKNELKTHDIGQLNTLYHDADTVDKEVFAEQRSNLLLVSGDHYTKRAYAYNRLSRGSDSNTKTPTLRITKNLTHKVYRYYLASLLDYAPNVKIDPNNKFEPQDVKDAQLYQSVKEYFDRMYRMQEKRREFASDFIAVGEVCSKMIFDPNQGEFIGYEQLVENEEPVFEQGEPMIDISTGQQAVDPVTGEPLFNLEPAPDYRKPVFKGKFEIERVPAFNLLRESTATSMRGAECWIIRKMVATKKLEAQYASDPEKLRMIGKGSEEEFIVFDKATSAYGKSKGQTLVKEFYFPVCHQYPEGYYYIATSGGILESGPLPGGIFPLVWAGFDEFVSTPRARGIVRVARPYQAEINRSSSATAMQQITVGDDKVLYQAGTKMAQGALLPGVRGLTYQGQPPTILPGRDGSQYYAYTAGTTQEMMSNLMVNEVTQEKGQGFDPMAFLFATAVERKKFSFYTEKFEQFLQDFYNLAMELCKIYLPDDELVYAVGKRELVNLAEFRKADKLRTQIKVMPSSDSLSSKLGNYFTGMQLLQYAGKYLERKDIGKIVRTLPFIDFGKHFDDLSIDEVNAENEILALERGETPQVYQYEDHDYSAKRLVARMKEPDFKFLPQPVQAAYAQLLAGHNAIIEQEAATIAAAKNEFIPADGPLIKVDMYVPKEGDKPGATERAVIPQRALEWLYETLAQQGMTLEKMKQMNKSHVAQIAEGIIAQAGGGMRQMAG